MLSLNSAWLCEIMSQIRKIMVIIFTYHIVDRTHSEMHCWMVPMCKPRRDRTHFQKPACCSSDSALITSCNQEREQTEGIRCCGDVIELSVPQKMFWKYEHISSISLKDSTYPKIFVLFCFSIILPTF